MMTLTSQLRVLLYYKYAPIDNPEKFCEDLRTFCKAHNLLGRILIASEGINGTCAGAPDDIDAFKEYMHKQRGFEDLWFKEQQIDHQPFPRLAIRVRPELVTLRVDNIDPQDPKKIGKHLQPSEVNDLVKEKPNDVVFFDARNEIESRIGKFKGAVTPNIKTFRDLPNILPKYKKVLKDKHVIMYCTGGIRCEKASALLKKEGFKNVYQINGGIYNYCQQYPNGLFEGTCFVFDDRMQIGWGNDNAVKLEEEMPKDRIISHCEYCDAKTARVVNDERYLDRVLRVCCDACDKAHDISRPRTKPEHDVMVAAAKKSRGATSEKSTAKTHTAATTSGKHEQQDNKEVIN